ncbi:hypothetical protein BDW42DRAFT_62349 [Aspergillus taichungensis]|uniref:Uncharacterized protein n=1 Tax=Aspergillus taichungensis TaxID=482145 RepID=A0A2J5I1L7_9EURO|nr:hypothetical protein BDW42DRAFT_62349 [Aspergillus taichungensis]
MTQDSVEITLVLDTGTQFGWHWFSKNLDSQASKWISQTVRGELTCVSKISISFSPSFYSFYQPPFIILGVCVISVFTCHMITHILTHMRLLSIIFLPETKMSMKS